jgi:hypothetical protein
VRLGGCSAIDLISILRKQREPLNDLKITVTGEREQGVVPALYTEVHAHFKLFGDINPDKAERAVQLSVEKYCSVAKTLEKTAVVTHSFEIINERLEIMEERNFETDAIRAQTDRSDNKEHSVPIYLNIKFCI